MEKELKLFATDMDGTLLRSDRTYNREKLGQILEEFDKRGWIFCAASGRQLLALEKLFAGFENQMAFVAENGGVVKYKGQTIFAETLNATQIKAIIEMLQDMPFAPKKEFLISGLKGGYSLTGVSKEFVEHASLYYANCQTVDAVDDIDDTFLKITTNFPNDHIRDCENFITEKLAFVRATTTGFTAIDIIPEGISKASGLAHLLAHLDWFPENLAAFGDQMNDYEMLKYAGTAYAVSNAVPEILAIADEVIGDHESDAVLVKLEQLLNEK